MVLQVKTIKLENGSVVTPDGVKSCDIVIRDGKIVLADADIKCDEVIDITGKYVVPGFVDIHFHGYNLFEFTAGRFDPKMKKFDDSESAYKHGFDMLSRQLARFGVTRFYVGTWAAPVKTLQNCYQKLADYLARPQPDTGAKILGGNIEGCFINPNMAGAQNPDLVFEQSPQAFDRIKDNGSIRLANVVPDFGRKSCELTEYLTAKNIIVGAGHTNGTCRQFEDAVKAGLKFFVHLTNGPTGSSTKVFNGGGALEAALKIDEIYAEQILDGFHVNPAYVRDIIKRKGTDKIIGVTDAVYPAGSDLKEFETSGIHGRVSDDGKYIYVVNKPNTLFSSNLTMNRAFNNTINWLSSDMQGIWNRMHKGLELEDALVAAAKICSSNACRLTGLAEQGYGSITDSAKADLCVLDIAGAKGDFSVTIDLTIVDGNIVYHT